MPFLPPVLGQFCSLIARFQCAAANGISDTAFERLVGELDGLARLVSRMATRQGRSDTDDTDLVAEIGGDATAIGDDTLAQVSMQGFAADVGLVSYAVGTATFSAAATSSGDGAAVAATSSFANVEGADLVLMVNVHSETSTDPGADAALSVSTTSFIAIDLEFWDSVFGPIVIESSRERNINPLHLDLDLDGNISTFDASFDARGTDTLATVDANVLSIEDSLSSVSAVAFFGVGGN